MPMTSNLSHPLPNPALHLARRPLAVAVLALLPLLASANQSLSDSGFGLTVGPVFNRTNLGSAAYNPANALRLIGDDEKVRIGVLQFGARYEIGAVDDVQKLSDSIKADVDAARASNNADQAVTLANKINSTYLPTLETGARANVQGQASLLAPLLWRTERLPGVWSFNVNAQAQASGAFRGGDMGVLVKFSSADANINGSRISVPVAGLASQLSTLQSAASSSDPAAQSAALQGLTGLLSTADQATLNQLISATGSGSTVGTSYALTSASAFDFKVAQVNQLSLGFATDLTDATRLQGLSPATRLDAGVRLSIYQARLYRQLAAFVDADGNSNTIELSSARTYQSNASALGVDLGLMWHDTNYQLGASLYNLNRPRLRYPSPLQDSNSANRTAAQQLAAAGKISLDDAVELKPHLVLEGSLFSADKRWLLQGSYAVNQTTDFVGDPHKRATVSAGFNAERFDNGWLDYLVPSVRVGYQRDLVGSKLSTIGLGLSWGVFNIDLNSSTQKVQADGSNVPRAAGVAISIAEKF
ncbi:MAG: hypothetical protein RLY71_589 [Pseudomonadota bacterium]